MRERDAMIFAILGAMLSVGIAWGMIQMKTEDLNFETEKQWADIEKLVEAHSDLRDRVSRLEGASER